MTPQPNYADGGWEGRQRNRFAYGPDERLYSCECAVLLGKRHPQPNCRIHGTRMTGERVRIRFVAAPEQTP